MKGTKTAHITLFFTTDAMMMLATKQRMITTLHRILSQDIVARYQIIFGCLMNNTQSQADGTPIIQNRKKSHESALVIEASDIEKPKIRHAKKQIQRGHPGIHLQADSLGTTSIKAAVSSMLILGYEIRKM